MVAIGVLGWLRIAKEVAEIVIPLLGWLGKKKAEKTVQKTEEVIETVIEGVERYKTVEEAHKLNPALPKPDVKETIKEFALSFPGVEGRLKKMVKRVRERMKR